MNKETFTELERLKTALTELEKCSIQIKEAKAVSEKFVIQVTELIKSYTNSSEKIIALLNYDSKQLEETRKNLTDDFGKKQNEFIQFIKKANDELIASIKQLNNQISIQLDEQTNKLKNIYGIYNSINERIKNIEQRIPENQDILIQQFEQQYKQIKIVKISVIAIGIISIIGIALILLLK